MLTKLYMRSLRCLGRFLFRAAHYPVTRAVREFDYQVQAVETDKQRLDGVIKANASLALARKKSAQETYHAACKKADKQAKKLETAARKAVDKKREARDIKAAKLASKIAKLQS